jgi:uncharacterized protein YraI
MPEYNDASDQLHDLALFVAILTLTLTLLACSLLGAGSQPISDRTIYRTRLPTLTPTLVSSSEGGMRPVEASIASPTTTPAPTFSPAENKGLTADNQSNQRPVLIALAGLNVRAGPGVDYATIGQLAQGQSSQLVGQSPDKGWWQIVYPPDGGGEGWVSADPQYVTVSGAEEIPIVQGLPLPAPTTSVVPTIAPTTMISQPTPTPASTATPDTSGWAFAGIRFHPDQAEDSLVLYGTIINNSGTAQEVAFVTGSFFDTQGQLIADEADTYDRWFVGIVPTGSQMPFELTVTGIRESAQMNLRVEAEPSDEPPRQDFEFLAVSSSSEWGDYCLSGELRNPGDVLEDYLVIVAVLYDHDDKVINFSDYEELALEDIVADQTLEFQICVDPLDQAVARYELQAWGL